MYGAASFFSTEAKLKINKAIKLNERNQELQVMNGQENSKSETIKTKDPVDIFTNFIDNLIHRFTR